MAITSRLSAPLNASLVHWPDSTGRRIGLGHGVGQIIDACSRHGPLNQSRKKKGVKSSVKNRSSPQ